MRRMSGPFVVCLLVVAVGRAEEPAPAALFNGKDLTGWKLAKGGKALDGQTEVQKRRFQIVDGAILIDGKERGNLVIETEKVFDKDVVITFEFRPGPKCNNDLYFRGNKFDIKPGGVKNLKEGEWHAFEIRSKGDVVTFVCNGEVQRTGKAKAPSPLGVRAEFGEIAFRKMRYQE